MQTLDQHVTEKNATAFVSKEQPFGDQRILGVTSAERAAWYIRHAVGELDRLRFHNKNSHKGGPWERITQLMQELNGIKDELDHAMDRAEELTASTTAK